ncbi:MAG: hypothetical protein K5912_01240, partial [Alphaproteobacteria bacterium]|nr:hypothetical protein [Alphaproteobacteria bacterium]
IDKSITLAICCDKKTESDIQKHIKSLNTPVNVNTYAFAIFDDMNYKWVSRGQMLFDVIQRVPHDYLCVLDGHEIMFRDHITTLKRALEDNPEKPVAYSGCFFESQTGERCVTLNKRILNKDIYDCVWPNNASNPGGAFLIDKKIENYLTDYICAYLDGTEVSAMLNIALFKHDKSFIYSKRTTCGSYKKPAPDYASVIDRAKQINLIHGLVTFDSSEIDYKQEAPVIFNESCIKTILSANRLRLKYRIIVLRLRNLFILKKSRRKRNKERIKKYKAQMRVTNLV